MRQTHVVRVIACAAAITLVVARTAHSQRDTLETGAGAFGVPVIASVPVGDIKPVHGIVHVAWTRDTALRHAWKDFGAWQQEAVADSALSYDIAVKGDASALSNATNDRLPYSVITEQHLLCLHISYAPHRR